MNKLKTMKKRKSVTLSKLIKLKRVEKQIKLESAKDLAQNEKSVLEGRMFSKIEKYLKFIRKTPSIPPTVNFDKTLASINVAKAEFFNQYFASGFSKSNLQPGYEPNNILKTANYTEEQISDILFELNPDKSTGPDKIGNTLLKKCLKNLCKSLKLFFRTCLNKQCYPSYWKICQTTPIFKEGNKADVTCYRPISLLCCCSKVMEKFLFDKIYCFFHSKFDTSQYGFRKRQSATLQLIYFLDKIHECNDLESVNELSFLYLDFAKAFDTVPHSVLISKLRSLGIGGNILGLLKSYLSQRKQYVQISSAKSTLRNVISGVPQGSILSPLLLLLFINNLPECMSDMENFGYADDFKVIVTNQVAMNKATDNKSKPGLIQI